MENSVGKRKSRKFSRTNDKMVENVKEQTDFKHQIVYFSNKYFKQQYDHNIYDLSIYFVVQVLR